MLVGPINEVHSTEKLEKGTTTSKSSPLILQLHPLVLMGNPSEVLYGPKSNRSSYRIKPF